MPQNVIDCESSVINPSDPLCERMQGLLNSGAVFCSFRNWAFNEAGDEVSDEFRDMMLGPAGGDLTGSTWPNLIVAPGVVTSDKMTPTGVTAGVYTNPTVEVDVAGRIVDISDGAAPVFGGNAQVTGAGANYTHATGIAFDNVVFGVTDPVIALPASGTYLITAVICGTSGAGVSSGVQAQLYNITGAAVIADSTREISLVTVSNATQGFEMVLSNIVTVGAASITIRVARASGTLLTVTAAQTSISYIRLA